MTKQQIKEAIDALRALESEEPEIVEAIEALEILEAEPETPEDIISRYAYRKGGGIQYPDLSKIKSDVVNDEIQEIPEVDIVKKDIKEYEGLPKITSSEQASKVFRQLWKEKQINVAEHFNVLLLNRANKPIGFYYHSKGGIDGTVADIQMICALAVKSLAKGVIVAHNHPSGNLEPSQADVQLSGALKEALSVFKIVLVDSLIIVPETTRYTSLVDEGKLKKGGRIAILGMGGRVKFKDKVKAIAKRLEGTKVPKRLQKDYGKTYDKAESQEAGRRIAGSILKRERLK